MQSEESIKNNPFGPMIGTPVVAIEREPLIPNSMYEVPRVSVFQAKVLAYIVLPDGFEGWFNVRPYSGYIAEIRPYNDRERAIAAKCNRPIPEGTYTWDIFGPLPEGSEIVRLARNPWLPIPSGCKLSDDGVNLIPV